MNFSCTKHQKLNKRPQRSIKIISRFVFKKLKELEFNNNEIITVSSNLVELVTKDLKKNL